MKAKLVQAKVPMSARNTLLQDFKFGFQQEGATRPPHSSNGNEIKEQDNDVAMLDTPDASTTLENSLIVKLRVYEGFDPSEYSTNATIVLPGFRYRFNPQSTVQERIRFSSIIQENVAGTLRGEPPNGEWTRVYGQYKPVLSEGHVVADGFWDELHGTAALKGAWLFDEEVVNDEHQGKDVLDVGWEGVKR